MLMELRNIGRHENQFGYSPVVTCGRTDRKTDRYNMRSDKLSFTLPVATVSIMEEDK